MAMGKTVYRNDAAEIIENLKGIRKEQFEARKRRAEELGHVEVHRSELKPRLTFKSGQLQARKQES